MATGIVLVVVAANIVRVIDNLDQYATTSEQMVIIITKIVILVPCRSLPRGCRVARCWRPELVRALRPQCVIG